MGTRYECDVAGCDGHASHANRDRGGIYSLPDGWYCMILKRPTPLNELAKAIDDAKLPTSASYRRRRLARGLLVRQAIICPKHPPLDLKTVPPPTAEEIEDMDDLEDIPIV